jgi:hypothetical protein
MGNFMEDIMIKKYNLCVILLILFCPQVYAIKYEKNGVTLEVTALCADDYAIHAHGWKITAAQLAKKGFKAFGVCMCNESDKPITVLPYVSGGNTLTATDIAVPFEYAQKTRAFIQFCVGIGTCYAAWRILTAEMLMHGFKVSALMANKSRSLSSKEKMRDTAAILKLWKQFSRIGWLGTGLATMVMAPLTWLFFYLSNKRCEKACQNIGLAAQYDIMPGQSEKKIVIVKADQVGTFGCELFTLEADDPFATYTVALSEVATEAEGVKEEIVSESLS